MPGSPDEAELAAIRAELEREGYIAPRARPAPPPPAPPPERPAATAARVNMVGFFLSLIMPALVGLAVLFFAGMMAGS